MTNVVTLISALLDNHGLEWDYEIWNFENELGAFYVKDRDDIIVVGLRTLIVRFYPDFLMWHAGEPSLTICLFDKGSEKLIERYIRYIRGSDKKNKSQK